MNPYDVLHQALTLALSIVRDLDKIEWASCLAHSIKVRSVTIDTDEFLPTTPYDLPISRLIEVLLDETRFSIAVPEERWNENAIFAHHYRDSGRLEFSIGLLQQPIELIAAVIVEEVFHLLDPFDREIPTDGPKWKKDELLYEHAQRRELRAKLFVRQVLLWWRMFGPASLDNVIERYEDDIFIWRRDFEETLPL